MTRLPLRLFIAAAVLATIPAIPTSGRADQGITSPTHRANVGKIVFSKAEIPFRKEDPNKLETTFRATDTVYGRVYLAKAVNNTTLHLSGKTAKATEGRYEVKVFVNGKNKAMRFGVFRQQKLKAKSANQWTSWRFEPHPVAGYKYADKQDTTRWAKIINTMPPGTHKVRVEIHVVEGQWRSKGPVAAGEISIIKKKGDRLGGGGKFPVDAYNGGDKAALKKAIRKALLDSRTAKSAKEIKDIALVTQWQEGRYRGTLVKYRKITAAVLWADKNSDGFCRYVSYNFVKDAKGKKWGPVRFKSFCNSCQEGDVACPK